MSAFHSFGLAPHILEAIERKGFTEPSPIQAAAIPILLEGLKDVVGQAQTGTGKTAAFGIPLLQFIQKREDFIQALILAPTRELALQITAELVSLKGTAIPEVLTVYGGQAIDVQLRKLSRGVDVVVGTPGRVIDLMNRKALDLTRIRFAVLDEADEMLNMGFIEDIQTILDTTPKDKRMLLFSATMPDPILEIAEKSMREYERINVRGGKPTLDLTDQFYYEVRFEEKFEALCRIIDGEPELYGMVFCKTKSDVDDLSERLLKRSYRVEALHGDIPQGQRTKVIEQFKNRLFSLLIATDVAARGIDVNDLTHVVNYALPHNADTYIHRIGRTGRAGKRGTAVTFVTPSELRKITWIKNQVKSDIRKAELPSPQSIVEGKKKRLADDLGVILENGSAADLLAFAGDLENRFGAEQTIAALLKLHCQDNLDAARYLEIGGKKSNPALRGANGQTVKLQIGAGKKQGFGVIEILDLIWETARVRKCRIGKIDCCKDRTFVEVHTADVPVILDAFGEEGSAPAVQVAAEDAVSAAREEKRDRKGSFFKKERKPYPERSAPPSDYARKAKAPFQDKKKKKAPPAWTDRKSDRIR